MSKFVVAILVTIFSNSLSFSVNKEVVPIKVEDEDVYLKTISDSVASHLKPIFEEWMQNGPFEVGGNFGPMEFFENWSDAFVRREAAAPTPPNVLESFQKHMEQFKSCIDQTLANTVDEVNAKQVQPVFEVIGDQLNKFSKAFEDLTATKAPA